MNGNWNGKGKEYYYWKDIIKFEGEFLNNCKIKGKEYFCDNGKLEFEGEYLNDKKWDGKGYDKNGNIMYELHNGKGTVKEYNRDGLLVYEDEYLNGQRHGKGKEYKYGTLIFEGEYSFGVKKVIDGGIKYELNGDKNGKRKEKKYKEIV